MVALILVTTRLSRAVSRTKEQKTWRSKIIRIRFGKRWIRGWRHRGPQGSPRCQTRATPTPASHRQVIQPCSQTFLLKRRQWAGKIRWRGLILPCRDLHAERTSLSRICWVRAYLAWRMTTVSRSRRLSTKRSKRYLTEVLLIKFRRWRPDWIRSLCSYPSSRLSRRQFTRRSWLRSYCIWNGIVASLRTMRRTLNALQFSRKTSRTRSWR